MHFLLASGTIMGLLISRLLIYYRLPDLLYVVAVLMSSIENYCIRYCNKACMLYLLSNDQSV